MNTTESRPTIDPNLVRLFSIMAAGIAYLFMNAAYVAFPGPFFSLLFLPGFLSAVIPSISWDPATNFVDRLEGWIRDRHWRILESGSWWTQPIRLFIGPAIWVMNRIETRVLNPHIRAGLNLGAMSGAAVALFFVGVQLLVLALFLIVLLAIAFFRGAVDVAPWGTNEGSAGAATGAAGAPMVRKNLNPAVERLKGKRIVNSGLLGDSPTNLVIDRNGRLLKQGLFNEQTGYRIKDDGRIVHENFFERDLGLRIKEDGRIVKVGLLDKPTEHRITEDGRLVKDGIFFDRDTGTKFK